MKYLLLLAALFTFYTGFGQNQFLQNYLTFDDCTATDFSSNHWNDSLIGNPTCVCGISGQAMMFDGNDDRIQANSNFTSYDPLKAGTFTISFAFRPENNTKTMTLLSKRNSCTPDSGFSVKYIGPSNTIRVDLFHTNPAGNNFLVYTLPANECWHYIAIQKTSIYLRLFVNGIKVSETVSLTPVDMTNSAPLLIGGSNCPGEDAFEGAMDEFRFYSGALTENEALIFRSNIDQIETRDKVVYQGRSVDVKITHSCAASYLWTPAQGVADVTNPNTTLTPDLTTTYLLHFNYTGCTTVDTIIVRVVTPDEVNCNELALPSAFTPNNDQLNDEFGLSNPYVISSLISFEIFDRLGNKLFSTTDPEKGWDGKYKDQYVNPGVFLYKVKYSCNNEDRVKTGSVTVIK